MSSLCAFVAHLDHKDTKTPSRVTGQVSPGGTRKVGIAAATRPRKYRAGLVNNANCDRLPVEVDAGKLHGDAFVLWKRVGHNNVGHASKNTTNSSASS